MTNMGRTRFEYPESSKTKSVGQLATVCHTVSMFFLDKNQQ